MIPGDFFHGLQSKTGTDGTEGVMVGAQGFGVTKDSQMKQEAFDFAYSICTGETDMKMTDAVNSIPADTDNTQWPEVLADAATVYERDVKAVHVGCRSGGRSGL